MALVKCKECGNDVSTSATACPKCGAPPDKFGVGTLTAEKKSSKKLSAKEILIGLVVGLSIIAWLASGEDKPKEQPTQQAKTEEPSCAKDDLQCLGDKGSIGASVYCKDTVERFAKYSVRWTDGMLETKFSRFRWKDKEHGVITYVGDKVEFQNGFGAYTPMVYECDLGPDDKTVLDVRVQEGRLPV